MAEVVCLAARSSTCRRHGVHPPPNPSPPPRSTTTQDSQAAKREKELADRRAYLQNFWYAAGEYWRAAQTIVVVRPRRMHKAGAMDTSDTSAF